LKPEHHKPIGKEKPKQKGKTSTAKRRMLATAQERKPITSPQLRETYSTKTEWAKRLIPKLEKETETSDGRKRTR
jgi:predicted HTH transcriptional regulator